LNNHFTVIIASYNVEKWVSKNLLSVLNQDYKNFDIVYIDDCSKDATYDNAKSILGARATSDNNFILQKNSYNKGKMENVFDAVRASKNDTIIVILDGDDWIANNNVLSYLNKIYSSDDVWMSNGSYMIEPTKEIVTPAINDDYWQGQIRQKSWQFSHLGSFRKQLFCNIKIKDLMSKDGSFWATTSDQAMMWPMAEMAGPEHLKVINDVLYVYNRLNPLSDDKVNRNDQLTTEYIIRNKEPYSRLKSL